MSLSYLYESTDSSAPTLLDGVGHLVRVLDACLVDGYGTKEGLGWTKEFYSPDGKIAVYRNKGTGLFLKVSNSVNYAATGMSAMIEVFEAMQAWDIGYLRTPETGVNQYFAYANTKTGARVCKWKLIGDDKGFWIITEFSTTANNFATAYFGDYTTYHLENKYNWINFTHTGVEVGHLHFYCPYAWYVNDNIRIARNHQNALPPTNINLYTGCGRTYNASGHTTAQLGYYSYSATDNYSVSPVPLFTKPYIGITPQVSPYVTTMIGEVPGLLECVSWTPSGTIVQQSASSAIHVVWINNAAKIGIIVGEGFRP